MKENVHNSHSQKENDEKRPDDKPHPNPPKEKEICLVFIVNGSPEKVQAKTNWNFKKAVEIALKESGNEGRPLTDWSVKWNNQLLDINKKIEDFHFPECVELFLSLNAGQGGSKANR